MDYLCRFRPLLRIWFDRELLRVWFLCIIRCLLDHHGPLIIGAGKWRTKLARRTDHVRKEETVQKHSHSRKHPSRKRPKAATFECIAPRDQNILVWIDCLRRNLDCADNAVQNVVAQIMAAGTRSLPSFYQFPPTATHIKPTINGTKSCAVS